MYARAGVLGADLQSLIACLLGLLGLPQDPRDEGRDASALLLSGRPPAGWTDVAFSRNSGGHWLDLDGEMHVWWDTPTAAYGFAAKTALQFKGTGPDGDD